MPTSLSDYFGFQICFRYWQGKVKIEFFSYYIADRFDDIEFNMRLWGRSRVSCIVKDNLRRYILIVWSMIDISSVQSRCSFVIKQIILVLAWLELSRHILLLYIHHVMVGLLDHYWLFEVCQSVSELPGCVWNTGTSQCSNHDQIWILFRQQKVNVSEGGDW